ncbi:MAG: lipid biosynthesis B12-binding/radical SAM protein [Thermodesulfobacteriota bacterium]|nr:lipid biosynthesis B12-binding/radical SAM protein [Thermodesulfobacteriota bacterium]
MPAECLLISANQVVTPYPVYPLGAACLLGSLQEKGHVASHFDVLADGGREGLDDYLSGKRFDLVGVSIRNLDTVDSAAPDECLTGVVEIVNLIRKNGIAPIVLGGSAFSIMPQALMELLDADYGVVGEGEELLPWLADKIASGTPPAKKIFYAESRKQVWQKPVFTESNARFYIKHGGMLNVQTKRGCPHSCSYCSYPTIEGRKIRYRDPQDVADEVARLQIDYGARYIFFTDSVFNDGQGHFLEVAEALIRQNNKVPWSAFFRPQNLERDHLRLLKRSGLAAVELGTDAATDITLAGINKKISFDDVLEIHERVISEGIPCAHFIMFGGPDEDEETLRQGLKNIEKLEKSVVFVFVGIRILPGTAIFDRAVHDDLIKADQSLLQPIFYFSPHVSRERIEEQVKQSFSHHMDRIYPSFEFEERIAMLHNMGHVGPLWNLVLGGQRRR